MTATVTAQYVSRNATVTKMSQNRGVFLTMISIYFHQAEEATS